MPNDASHVDFAQDPEAERWHYRPDHPVRLNPLFQWPIDLRAVWNWYRGAWLALTSMTVCMALALVIYFAFLPPLDSMKSFEPGWMFTVWLLNVIPQTVVAGSLHWWLYIRKGQGMVKKFDKRDLNRSNGSFTFKNQVWDNIWWTLGSAMTVSTVYQWGIYWAMANGWLPSVTFGGSPVWFVLWLALIPAWSSLHFYWVHRLAHSPRLDKHVHAVHHRNVNVGPWSGISNHWYENMLYFTTYFIHLISPVFSHSGFEKLVKNDSDVARAGDFFHQLHHRYFECNYGTSEIPFNRWFGTFHDGSAEATSRTRAHKKQMYTK